MISKLNNLLPKSLLLRGALTLTFFATVFGAAATLGGITSDTVGADDTLVASCDTDGVSTAYTTVWDATDVRYEVSTVTVSGVSDTCDGLNLRVSLTDGTTQLGTGTVAIPTSAATSFPVTVTPNTSAENTTGVHVAIS